MCQSQLVMESHLPKPKAALQHDKPWNPLLASPHPPLTAHSSPSCADEPHIALPFSSSSSPSAPAQWQASFLWATTVAFLTYPSFLHQWFNSKGQILHLLTTPARSHLSMLGDISDCHKWGGVCVGMILTSSWQRPDTLLTILYSIAPLQPTRNYLVLDSVKVEKSCFRCIPYTPQTSGQRSPFSDLPSQYKPYCYWFSQSWVPSPWLYYFQYILDITSCDYLLTLYFLH